MKTLALKDFLKYQFLSDLQYAPDGKRAAFVVSSSNEAENTYDRTIWILENETCRQQMHLKKESDYLWEDNTHILFQAEKSEDGVTRYERFDVQGGEAEFAFELPFAAKKVMKIAGNQYAVLGEIDFKFPDYYKMSKEEREAVISYYKEEEDYRVIDELPFWRNGGGYVANRRVALFVVDVEKGTCQRITGSHVDVEFADVYEGKVYYLGNHFETRRKWRQKVYRYDPQQEVLDCVYDKEDMDLSGVYLLHGKVHILGSQCLRYGMNENPYLYEVNEETKDAIPVWVNEESVGNSVGSDCRLGRTRTVKAVGDALYYLSTRRNSAHLYKITPDFQTECVLDLEGSLDDFDINAQGEILGIAMWDGKLQEVYHVDAAGSIKQCSHLNQAVLEDVYVAEYEKITVESQGVDIDGWILKPKDYDPSKTYPAILDIHGGPKTAYGEVFYHEMQLWANMGYFVFFSNPFGGDGRGNEFTEVRGKYGTIDYENLMDFTDAVLAKYPQIDKERLGVTGGSYGGFMTNWIIGHTNRFAAAATQRSITNWLSFFGTSDIGPDFGADHQLANIYDNPEKLWFHSPMKYAGNIKTPTLIIHAEEDYRCPMSQAMQLYSSLEDRGIPAKLCCFKGENHELSRSGKPKHRVRRLQEITNWMEKYLK